MWNCDELSRNKQRDYDTLIEFSHGKAFKIFLRNGFVESLIFLPHHTLPHLRSTADNWINEEMSTTGASWLHPDRGCKLFLLLPIFHHRCLARKHKNFQVMASNANLITFNRRAAGCHGGGEEKKWYSIKFYCWQSEEIKIDVLHSRSGSLEVEKARVRIKVFKLSGA